MVYDVKCPDLRLKINLFTPFRQLAESKLIFFALRQLAEPG
jgi:hypothetical protein